MPQTVNQARFTYFYRIYYENNEVCTVFNLVQSDLSIRTLPIEPLPHQISRKRDRGRESVTAERSPGGSTRILRKTLPLGDLDGLIERSDCICASGLRIILDYVKFYFQLLRHIHFVIKVFSPLLH